MIQSMMSYTHVPDNFWGYAVETIVYILNNVYQKVFLKHLLSYGKVVKAVYDILEFGNVRHMC